MQSQTDYSRHEITLTPRTFIKVSLILGMISQIIIISLIRTKRRIKVRVLEISSFDNRASKQTGIHSRFSKDQVVPLFSFSTFSTSFTFAPFLKLFFEWCLKATSVLVKSTLNPFLFPLRLECKRKCSLEQPFGCQIFVQFNCLKYGIKALERKLWDNPFYNALAKLLK